MGWFAGFIKESIKIEKVSFDGFPNDTAIVTVVFDELGLTDNKNPFGLISFLHPFLDLLSAGKSVKINKKNRKTNFDIFRKKRSIEDPKVDPELIHGGERAFLYQVKKKNIFFSS